MESPTTTIPTAAPLAPPPSAENVTFVAGDGVLNYFEIVVPPVVMLPLLPIDGPATALISDIVGT